MSQMNEEREMVTETPELEEKQQADLALESWLRHWRGLRNLKSFPGGSDSKESACNAVDLGSIPGSGRSLEEGMATRSNILAWRIPWTEEPGGLHPWGRRVGHD